MMAIGPLCSPADIRGRKPRLLHLQLPAVALSLRRNQGSEPLNPSTACSLERGDVDGVSGSGSREDQQGGVGRAEPRAEGEAGRPRPTSHLLLVGGSPPASSLAGQSSGRAQASSDWIMAGIIDAATSPRLGHRTPRPPLSLCWRLAFVALPSQSPATRILGPE